MEVKINGTTWNIKEVDTRSQELNINGNQCYGTCKYHTQEICLDSSLKKSKKYQTLKHELAHAFISCHLLEQKKSYSEEEMCEYVALYADNIVEIASHYMEVAHNGKTD